MYILDSSVLTVEQYGRSKFRRFQVLIGTGGNERRYIEIAVANDRWQLSLYMTIKFRGRA